MISMIRASVTPPTVIGWTWLWVGEVADPNESILYQSSPLLNIFPTIQTDRGNLFQNTLSIGVNWNY